VPQADYVQGGVARPTNIAGLEVILPTADGEVWLQGQKQTGSGTTRRFFSPPLEPGRDFTYTIDAAWYENGQLVTQKRQVDVRAETLHRIDFTTGPEPAEAPQPAAPNQPPPPNQPPQAQPPVQPPPPIPDSAPRQPKTAG
jgi:uncharacterized protein (TIGR03000 family)